MHPAEHISVAVQKLKTAPSHRLCLRMWQHVISDLERGRHCQLLQAWSQKAHAAAARRGKAGQAIERERSHQQVREAYVQLKLAKEETAAAVKKFSVAAMRRIHKRHREMAMQRGFVLWSQQQLQMQRNRSMEKAKALAKEVESCKTDLLRYQQQRQEEMEEHAVQVKSASDSQLSEMQRWLRAQQESASKKTSETRTRVLAQQLTLQGAAERCMEEVAQSHANAQKEILELKQQLAAKEAAMKAMQQKHDDAIEWEQRKLANMKEDVLNEKILMEATLKADKESLLAEMRQKEAAVQDRVHQQTASLEQKAAKLQVTHSIKLRCHPHAVHFIDVDCPSVCRSRWTSQCGTVAEWKTNSWHS